MGTFVTLRRTHLLLVIFRSVPLPVKIKTRTESNQIRRTRHNVITKGYLQTKRIYHPRIAFVLFRHDKLSIFRFFFNPNLKTIFSLGDSFFFFFCLKTQDVPRRHYYALLAISSGHGETPRAQHTIYNAFSVSSVHELYVTS